MNADRKAIADAAKGWLGVTEGPFLREMALSTKGPYLEAGSYCGKSTVWIGDAAETKGTVLFAVDHHRGSPEMEPGKDCHDPDVLIDGLHDTLPTFRRTIHEARLDNIIVPVVAATKTLHGVWRIPVSFVFIDAAHDYRGCSLDAATWCPWVPVDGLVAFHDTTIPDIARVLSEAVQSGCFTEHDECDTVRVLRRVS